MLIYNNRTEEERTPKVKAEVLYNLANDALKDEKEYKEYMECLPQYQRISERDFELLFPDARREGTTLATDPNITNHHLSLRYAPSWDVAHCTGSLQCCG